MPTPVDGERVPADGLDNQPVQDRAKDGVVVEPGCQGGVQSRQVRFLAVHDPLVEIGGPHVPRPARELDVVAVVDFRQMVKGSRPLGI